VDRRERAQAPSRREADDDTDDHRVQEQHQSGQDSVRYMERRDLANAPLPSSLCAPERGT
jgi:hypothetical protein